LGRYVQEQVPEKKIILFEGYCYVHNRIKADEIESMRELYPEAKVLVHPEARMEVIWLADEVLSTSGIIKYVTQSNAQEFIIATEQGLLERIKRENPGKKIYPAFKPKICSNMKRTSLQDVFDSLKEEKYEIIIDPEISVRAVKALDTMLRHV
jgi:quinolinate synthase